MYMYNDRNEIWAHLGLVPFYSMYSLKQLIVQRPQTKRHGKILHQKLKGLKPMAHGRTTLHPCIAQCISAMCGQLNVNKVQYTDQAMSMQRTISRISIPYTANMLRGSSMERGSARLFHCSPNCCSSRKEMTDTPSPNAVLENKLRASLPPLLKVCTHTFTHTLYYHMHTHTHTYYHMQGWISRLLNSLLQVKLRNRLIFYSSD